ncbi:MAG: hypothetical protein E7613_10010 [Ruminococcaceae bacterium]|nr:hypothetical protein [Oscillospiraceae bacterium]
MEIFKLTLSQMLMMFTLILVGFILKKKSPLPDNSHTVMSKLETFAITPALALFTMMSKCTVKTFVDNSRLILYGFVTIICALLLSYPLSKLFIRNHRESSALEYQRNVYKYAMTFGNFGFMGNFIVLGVWGEDMFYKYSLFTLTIWIICNSWGLFILIPKDKNASVLSNLKKGLLTPPIIALVSGILLGLVGTGKYVPDFIMTALDKTGSCQGPIAMLLAGFVIGGYDFKGLILNKKVYIASFLRLIVIPSVLLLVLGALGTSKEIMTLALVAFATPLGLNTIVYPAAYGGDPETGASMAMISHTLSVATIPLMYLVFIA